MNNKIINWPKSSIFIFFVNCLCCFTRQLKGIHSANFTFNTNLHVLHYYGSFKMLYTFSQWCVHNVVFCFLYNLGTLKHFKRCVSGCVLFSPANDVDFTSSLVTSPGQWCRPCCFVNPKAPVTLGYQCHTHRLLGQNPLPFISLQPIGKRMFCTLSFSFGVYSIGEHQSKTPRMTIGSYKCQ